MTGTKTTRVPLPSGGPLEISEDVARLFMLQIEMYSCGGVNAEPLSRKLEATLSKLSGRQLDLAHAIAASLVRITK